MIFGSCKGGKMSFLKMFKQKKSGNSGWVDMSEKFMSLMSGRKAVSNRDKSEILKILHKSPWFNLAIDIRSNNVAAAEYYLEETLRNGETSEIVEHPILDLLRSPNPLLLGYTQDYITSAWLDAIGECLLLFDRDVNNKIEGIYPISCRFIKGLPRAGYPYWRLQVGNEIKNVPITELIYIKVPDLYDIYGRGAGKGESLNDELSIHELSGKQIGQYFANSAIPPYIMGLEGANKEQAERLRDNFLNNNQGWVKRYLPYFLAGKIHPVKLQSEFKDMELNNLRKDQRDVIMNIFQVPEELYGRSKNSNKATASVAETNFAKQVITPRLKLMTEHYNAFLLPEFQEKNKTLKLKFRSVVPRDKDFERETKKTTPWAFSINEHRRTVGASDIEGLDDVYPIPMGIRMVKFDDLTTQEQAAIKSIRTDKNFKKASDAERLAELIGTIDSVAYEDLNKDVIDEYISLLVKTGTATLVDLGELEAGDFWEISNPNIISAMEDTAADRITMIDDTLKKNIRNEIIESYNNGEDMSDLVKRLDNVFDGYKSGYELSRIARTETMTTVNYGTLKAYEEADVPYKEWISTQDDRTRDTHLALDGQTVPVDSKFETFNNDTASAPGQFSSADENIGCRCTIGAKFDKKDATKRFEHWQKQDSRAEEAEEDFADVYSERFAKIQQLIEDSLLSL